MRTDREIYRQRLRSVVLLFSCILLAGCQRYGEVSSETSNYASALYSICNMKDVNRLEAFEQKLLQTDDLPTEEARWLLEIVELGKANQWDRASSRVRQLFEEQVSH